MMRNKFIAVLICSFVLVISGCGEKRRVSREANSLTAAFVILMKKGVTTRDQEKRFIIAISKVSYQLDRNIRGDKKAKKTRDSAEKLANAGINPDSSLDVSSTRVVLHSIKSEDILSDIEDLSKDIEKAVTKIKED